MANSIDWSTLTLGALIGVGCRRQLQAAGRVAASTAATLATAAAQAAADVAEEAREKSPEQATAGQGQNPNGH